MKKQILKIATASVLCLSSCALEAPPLPLPLPPATSQLPAESPYGRTMISHLPHPIPSAYSQSSINRRDGLSRHESTNDIDPTLDFNLPDSSLEEAMKTLARAMNYRAIYAPAVAKRPLSITMNGTIDDICDEIEAQARVKIVIDTKRNTITAR